MTAGRPLLSRRVTLKVTQDSGRAASILTGITSPRFPPGLPTGEGSDRSRTALTRSLRASAAASAFSTRLFAFGTDFAMRGATRRGPPHERRRPSPRDHALVLRHRDPAGHAPSIRPAFSALRQSPRPVHPHVPVGPRPRAVPRRRVTAVRSGRETRLPVLVDGGRGLPFRMRLGRRRPRKPRNRSALQARSAVRRGRPGGRPPVASTERCRLRSVALVFPWVFEPQCLAVISSDHWLPARRPPGTVARDGAAAPCGTWDRVDRSLAVGVGPVRSSADSRGSRDSSAQRVRCVPVFFRLERTRWCPLVVSLLPRCVRGSAVERGRIRPQPTGVEGTPGARPSRRSTSSSVTWSKRRYH